MNKYIYYLFPNSDTVKFVTHMVHMCKTQLNIKMHGEQNIYFLKWVWGLLHDIIDESDSFVCKLQYKFVFVLEDSN